LCTNNAKCGQLLENVFAGTANNIEVLAIPLQYRERVLGVYNLFLEKSKQTKLENEAELLISIGQHLGMAIEKASVDEDARTLSIMEERTRMAHELHDSLAQTLASLRFKVRLFDDSLNRGEEATIWQELEGLENTIDEAYAELRSLITHFRAPLDGKGIIRVVERLVERFRQETKMEVFYYHNWHLKDLPSEIELEAIRIVQEALANVRKHSRAKTVRILLYSSEEGKCSILVEDDGIGLPVNLPEPDPKTGEHIGLTVMRARADRVGGDLQFESEPGEGTLIQLNFEVLPTKKLSDLVKRTSIHSTTSLASDTP
jgi:two-component system nitrate/nitrite sensor histidine kinase NarX